MRIACLGRALSARASGGEEGYQLGRLGGIIALAKIDFLPPRICRSIWPMFVAQNNTADNVGSRESY